MLVWKSENAPGAALFVFCARLRVPSEKSSAVARECLAIGCGGLGWLGETIVYGNA